MSATVYRSTQPNTKTLKVLFVSDTPSIHNPRQQRSAHSSVYPKLLDSNLKGWAQEDGWLNTFSKSFQYNWIAFISLEKQRAQLD